MANRRQQLVLLLNNSASDPLADYNASVLATSPIFYAPLVSDESTTMDDTSTNDNNGTYNGVTVQSSAGPAGGLAPLWDGTNDYGTFKSAGFESVIDPDEITFVLWAKATTAYWNSTTQSRLLRIVFDGNNIFQLYKSGANSVEWLHRAAGLNRTVTQSAISSNGWVSFVMSGSLAGGGLLAAGETELFYNGVSSGTNTPIGTNSTATITDALLGAFNTTPISVWSGHLAHFAVFDKPVDADILALATIAGVND